MGKTTESKEQRTIREAAAKARSLPVGTRVRVTYPSPDLRPEVGRVTTAPWQVSPGLWNLEVAVPSGARTIVDICQCTPLEQLTIRDLTPTQAFLLARADRRRPKGLELRHRGDRTVARHLAERGFGDYYEGIRGMLPLFFINRQGRRLFKKPTPKRAKARP